MTRSSFPSPNAAPYFNSAREQTAIYWALGHWESLLDCIERCGLGVDGVTGAYKVAALMQIGHFEEAKAFLEGLALDESARDTLLRLLISGAINSLGKANAYNFNNEVARGLIAEAVGVGLPHLADQSIAAAREASQLGYIGIPSLQMSDTKRAFNPDIENFLQSATAFFPYEPSLEVALADYYHREELFEKAIVHWQKVAQLLERETPQPYYDQLKSSYRESRAFPLGSVAQEAVRGDTDKHILLTSIHNNLKPEFYFEIGVQTGKSLALANCEALGVDPMPLLREKLSENATVITASSDAFFKSKSDVLLAKSVDLVLVDGMHLFEYALRDFINIERYLTASSVVVIDDVFPGHADQASRDRCTRAWTGDIWKILKILDIYRPDLITLTIDAHPTGLLLVTGFESGNSTLADKYNEIIDAFGAETLSEGIIERSGAVSGADKKVGALLDLCLDAKARGWGAMDLRQKWLSYVAA